MRSSVLFTALFLLSMLHQSLLAQEAKDEIEETISRDEMPVLALDALEEFTENQTVSGIKYFRETDGETTTFEVKLEWQDDQYSIEFNDAGSLLDIEQLVEFNEIPEEVQQRITQMLEDQYTRYRITRVQKQFIAEEEDDEGEDVIEDLSENDLDDLLLRYEIEVEGQNRQEMGAFELLFDSEGELIQRRRIVRRSLDNIW